MANVVRNAFLKAADASRTKGVTKMSKSPSQLRKEAADKEKEQQENKPDTQDRFAQQVEEAFSQIAAANAAQVDYSESVDRELPDRGRDTGDVSPDSEAQEVALKERTQDIKQGIMNDPKIMASMKADVAGGKDITAAVKDKIRVVEKGFLKPSAGIEKQR